MNDAKSGRWRTIASVSLAGRSGLGILFFAVGAVILVVEWRESVAHAAVLLPLALGVFVLLLRDLVLVRGDRLWSGNGIVVPFFGRLTALPKLLKIHSEWVPRRQGPGRLPYGRVTYALRTESVTLFERDNYSEVWRVSVALCRALGTQLELAHTKLTAALLDDPIGARLRDQVAPSSLTYREMAAPPLPTLTATEHVQPIHDGFRLIPGPQKSWWRQNWIGLAALLIVLLPPGFILVLPGFMNIVAGLIWIAVISVALCVLWLVDTRWKFSIGPSRIALAKHHLQIKARGFVRGARIRLDRIRCVDLASTSDLEFPQWPDSVLPLLVIYSLDGVFPLGVGVPEGELRAVRVWIETACVREVYGSGQ